MSRYERIRQKLESELKPEHLELADESSNHHVPKGSESHFRVVLISDSFDGLASVKRHQLVYALLQEELDSGLHALSLKLFSPKEWADQPKLEASPDCRGGNRI